MLIDFTFTRDNKKSFANVPLGLNVAFLKKKGNGIHSAVLFNSIWWKRWWDEHNSGCVMSIMTFPLCLQWAQSDITIKYQSRKNPNHFTFYINTRKMPNFQGLDGQISISFHLKQFACNIDLDFNWIKLFVLCNNNV